MADTIKDVLLRGYFLARLPLILASRAFIPRNRSGGLGNPERVLVIRLDRLGDLVMTMPAIENIKRALPGAAVTALVRPYLAGLASSIAMIDDVIVYTGFVSTVRRLRRERFDLVIDMLDDYLLKPALLAGLSGAPRRAGFSGGNRELLFTDVAAGVQAGRSMADIHLDVVRALGIPVTVAEPRIFLKEALPPRGRVVAIHPGGHYPSQRWPAERFAALAKRVAETYGVRIVVIGGPDDRARVSTIMKGLAGLDAEERFPDMKGLAMLLAEARLLICNNSGPLHLAAAVGTPTVSTMGPTDPALWQPSGPKNIVIRKELPCSPCGRPRCRSHECMDQITVEEMFAAVRTGMAEPLPAEGGRA